MTSVRFKSLGCWKDTHKRAVPIVIGWHNTPASCARKAAARGMNTFSIQAGTWCAIGNNPKYYKYGKSKGCRHGKGGGWANSVYRITKGLAHNSHKFWMHIKLRIMGMVKAELKHKHFTRRQSMQVVIHMMKYLHKAKHVQIRHVYTHLKHILKKYKITMKNSSHFKHVVKNVMRMHKFIKHSISKGQARHWKKHAKTAVKYIKGFTHGFRKLVKKAKIARRRRYVRRYRRYRRRYVRRGRRYKKRYARRRYRRYKKKYHKKRYVRRYRRYRRYKKRYVRRSRRYKRRTHKKRYVRRSRVYRYTRTHVRKVPVVRYRVVRYTRTHRRKVYRRRRYRR
jgi:hypothetical protein